MAGPAHQGLGAFQLEFRIIALAERAVAVAGQHGAEFGQAHVAVHFGVTAAHDVEVEFGGGGFDYLGAQRVFGGPERLDGAEVVQAGLPVGRLADEAGGGGAGRGGPLPRVRARA